ncbi:MAG: NahK/ErcS family hybrid sensor histidine kinase/response regulator [Lysobacterales bacterium]
MESPLTLILISLLYLGSLFYVAYWGDRRPQLLSHPRLRRWIYSLALAVYCTTWTIYGAVGTASAQGWAYLPIYLGPLLVWLLLPALFERLVLISRQQKTASIADLIAARFGRSSGLAALISAIALLAAIPYIALQLKAISTSLAVMLPNLPQVSRADIWHDSAIYVGAILALFAVMFGTRRVSATDHRPGLILAVAVESVVKLVGLLTIALLAMWSNAEWSVPPSVAAWQGESMLSLAFLLQTLLAALAIACLPRQFHVTVVECADPADLGSARRIFIAYLVLVSLAVLPIAWTAVATAPAGVSPDSYVLWLPLSMDQPWLALLAFIGGLSAGTGMVIVASVALSTMVSNDLLMPALMRVRLLRLEERGDLSGVVLTLRRLAILGLTAAALLFHRLTDAGAQLASIGLIAFSAVAQFGPALLAALYSRLASAAGVRIGLTLGFATWIYTILLPALAQAGWIPGDLVIHGPWGIAPLAPTALLGLRGLDPITHGVLWSLLLNAGGLLVGSLRYPPSLAERLQAAPFLDPYALRLTLPEQVVQRVTQGELCELASRLLGIQAARAAFIGHARGQGRRYQPDAPADRQLISFTERQLAAVVGTASARVMLTSALRGSGLELGEVVSLLDDASQELRFNRELLQATMENVAQGISVVDAQLRLVSWNRRYLELFGFPEGMVYVGRPVADLIRFNAERGECGPGEVEDHVDRRLAHMRRGSPHVAQRVRPNGMVLEMRGQPMPGGGFVTTFSDVTDYKAVEARLRDLTDALEQRVTERTQALQASLEAQRAAKREAETANASKSRFLAAASHDLLQPLHAARLFAAALRHERGLPADANTLVQRIDSSLTAAEDLLSALLDISRLERGVLKPERVPIDVRELFEQLGEQFTPIAEQRNLSLRVHPLADGVCSDRQLLRRILQNFLSNAIRYTRQGGVLLGARRRGDSLELGVWDTGPGIAPEHQARIFEEFHRLEDASASPEQGLGLGLAIVDRAARTLGHPISLRSRPGDGSQFCILVPRLTLPQIAAQVSGPASHSSLQALRVLCVDNEPAVLEAMAALLGRWGCTPVLAADRNSALDVVANDSVDLLLADYHLDADNGLDLIAAVRGRVPRLPAALVTADRSEQLANRARAATVPILAKPVKPAALRALIGALAR